MTVRQFEILIQEYEEQAITTGNQRPITETEKIAIFQSIENIPAEYSEAFEKAEAGNFSQFDSLPLILKTYLGAIRIGQLRERFKNDFSLNNEELKSYLKEHAMDMSLRTGISVEKNSKNEDMRDTAMAFDTFMNSYVMQNTIMPPTEEAKQALIASIGEDEANNALAKDLKRQRVLAKTYLLAQLGKYDILDEKGNKKDLDMPLSETLAHGSRTNFILPSGTDTRLVIDAYMGTNDEEAPVIEERTAATHYVKRRAVDKNGMIKSETKESRTYSPLKVFSHQYGMDLSVGGIGKKGPGGKVISGNGESGHAYMRIEEGDEKHCASLLFGIEGSAPGKDSALGHSHGASGVSANQSAFFTDKQIIGAKNGGRQVDISGISSERLANILNQFSENYANLQRNPEGREKLVKLNDMLMGKRMNINKMMEMFAMLGMTDRSLNDTVSQAREGYLGKFNAKDIPFEQFTQSVRGKMSQEKACQIAKARFAYAGDNLQLATGAIKELMFTHETRSLLWKIRHPIKNYRENKMISDLTNKLVSEKKFTKDQIASAFNCYDNSFALNWGDKLSNDRNYVSFAKESYRNIQFNSIKMLNVIRSVSKKFGGKLSDPKVGDEEYEQMQDELNKLLNGEQLYDDDEIEDDEELEEDKDIDRESISIDEENELNKSVDIDTSEIIIPDQPTVTNKKEL